MWTCCQCKLPHSRYKVGCKWFFSISGYVLSPCHTKLGVWTYKRMTLLSLILDKVYVDKKWVTIEYLRMYKEGV